MAYQNYDRVQMNRNAFEVQGKENESKIKKTKQMEEEDLKEI